MNFKNFLEDFLIIILQTHALTTTQESISTYNEVGSNRLNYVQTVIRLANL